MTSDACTSASRKADRKSADKSAPSRTVTSSSLMPGSKISWSSLARSPCPIGRGYATSWCGSANLAVHDVASDPHQTNTVTIHSCLVATGGALVRRTTLSRYGCQMTGGRRLALLIFLFALSVGLLGLSVYTASTRETSALENTLLQFLGIFAGAAFSWLIGDGGGQDRAEKEMRARARPAFRRVVRLYEAHGRVVGQIGNLGHSLAAQATNGKVDLRLVDAALNTIAVQVSEQLGTANDAMEDWRDLAPDDVEELERRANRQDEEGNNVG